MNFDYLQYRYPSRRSVIFGKKGMVCTSQPLAAQAGLDTLKKGGNVVDAIITTATCMTVLEPTSNGLGSDAFALYWDAKTQKLYGLNGSGFAPAALTPEAMQAKGYTAMPDRGWASVTIPGAPSAWAELHKRFGKMAFADCLEPAINYAENGFPLQPVVGQLWEEAVETFAPYKDKPEFQPFFATFMKNGNPTVGSLVKLPDQAKTLRELAATQCESYYRGAIAQAFAKFAKETGGYITAEDLAKYRAEWVEPIHTDYHGYTICEIPPNGQGLVVLMTLDIMDKLALQKADHDDVATIHKQIEAMKQAFIDGMTYISDAHSMKQMSVEHLLSDTYAEERAKEITDTALMPKPSDPYCGGTVYLCAADEEGNMISYIQSNYKGFGSGIVIPGYGIALNDRACGFSLNSHSDDYLVPGKKPYHTIIPGFLMKEGKAVGPFGVMGAYMQPQGQVQVLMNMIDFGMNPQEALDAPRWQWLGGKKIEIEPDFGPHLAEALRKRGHQVAIQPDFIGFGRGQIILRDENGVLTGATEPRADGCVAAW